MGGAAAERAGGGACKVALKQSFAETLQKHFRNSIEQPAQAPQLTRAGKGWEAGEGGAVEVRAVEAGARVGRGCISDTDGGSSLCGELYICCNRDSQTPHA